MKNKKLIRWIIAIVILLIIALFIARKKGLIGKQDKTKVAVENVVKRDIFETVSASGKITPEFEIKLSPDVSGEIVELYVKEGEHVEKGKLIAKINPELYRSSYDRAVAGLNTSRANLSNTKARLMQSEAQLLNTKASHDRNIQLHNQKAISDIEFEKSQLSYDVAQSEVLVAQENVKAAEFNVNSAEAGVKEASENLYKTSIYSPVSGIISKLNVEKGERVAGASQFGSGTEILRIANLNTMEVNVEVNENDIVRIKMNDTAYIEVDAYQNRKFKGVVTQIAISSKTVGVSADQVANFDVKIRILPESYSDLMKESSPFRPGMSANVDIITNRQQNSIAIPIQALTTRAENILADTTKNTKENVEQKECVFVYENGIAKLNFIKTGVQDNNYIQVLSGLKENQQVITAPFRIVSKKLKDGDHVQKVDEKTLL